MDSISTKQLLTKTRKFLAKLPSLIIDKGACLLLPDEFNGYICADTTADGNCLYNTVSYFFIHENSLSTQIRLSTILELMTYADEHLVLEVFEKDYSYSDRAFSKANNKRYQQLEYRNIAPFVAEIMEMCRIGAWSPLGALYAKSQIGFGQSAVSKIVKRAELPANALTRDAIKLWIEKQTESKQGICGMIKLNNNIIKISFV
ncbi:unnamed protein product [Rhizophagus irregularis]|uniref:Vertnin n=1 Tax=Rhizophagus irregularis TaxID=588596 RepID=A0A915Z6M6_9GLOM|nr:unnamed protein product [Rhizophagus irregularis]